MATPSQTNTKHNKKTPPSGVTVQTTKMRIKKWNDQKRQKNTNMMVNHYTKMKYKQKQVICKLKSAKTQTQGQEGKI